jgi:putative redox protein
MATHSATVKWKDGMAFEAAASSGHSVTLDSSEEVGGHNQGFRPMEMLLVGLGGCTGMDVISILRKMQQQVSGYEVRVDGDRATEHPKVYTDITVEHVVTGKGLVEASVRRAVELSATKYCSASAMLAKAARVTHRYRIVDEETGSEVAGTL